MQTKSYFFQMAVKAVEKTEDGGLIIEGLASTPDLDRYRDIVDPEAFKDALELYMKNPVILRSHDADRPIGNTLSAIVTNKGLKIRAEIKDTKTIEEIEDGRMRALSIGYIPLFTELQHEDGSAFNAENDSPWDADIVRVIKQLDLVEISVVSTPANGNALFTIAKSVKNAVSDLVTKGFNTNSSNMKIKNTEEDEKKDDEQLDKPENEETPETPEGEESEEDAAEEPEKETPEGEDEPESKSEEDAEKAGETPAADDAEGDEPEGEEPEGDEAEEAKADAEPDDEEGEDEPDEEKDKDEKAINAALVMDVKTVRALPTLAKAGAVRAKSADDDEPEAIPEPVQKFLAVMDKAFAMAQKEVEDYKAKLDAYEEKKPEIAHSQQDEEEGKEGKNATGISKKRTPSVAFMRMFR